VTAMQIIQNKHVIRYRAIWKHACIMTINHQKKPNTKVLLYCIKARMFSYCTVSDYMFILYNLHSCHKLYCLMTITFWIEFELNWYIFSSGWNPVFEIEKVLGLGVDPSRIVYANSIKQTSFIKYSAQNGVDLMTFDNKSNSLSHYAFN
jgi:hypothetical protein